MAVVQAEIATARGERGFGGEKVPGKKLSADTTVPEIKTPKQKGALTEPKLPQKTIGKEGEVEIVHYTKSGDHGQHICMLKEAEKKQK